jgi:hypothetical protein
MFIRSTVRGAIAVAVACLFVAPHARTIVRAPSSQTYIQQENAKPGTTDWQLTNTGWTTHDSHSRCRNG